MLISVPAIALALGSWIALLPAACFVLVLVRRTQIEDEFLKKNLGAYAAYARRVPAVWPPLPPTTECVRTDRSGWTRTFMKVTGSMQAARTGWTSVITDSEYFPSLPHSLFQAESHPVTECG